MKLIVLLIILECVLHNLAFSKKPKVTDEKKVIVSAYEDTCYYHLAFLNEAKNEFITNEFKIYRDSLDKRYFILDSTKYYLDVDSSARSEISILNFFIDHVAEPEIAGFNWAYIFLIFLINEDGEIQYSGVDRYYSIDDLYQEEYLRVTKKIDWDFIPAMVSGKNVGSVYVFYINWSKKEEWRRVPPWMKVKEQH